MGIKLLWLGATIIAVSLVWVGIPALPVVGVVIMGVGCVLNILGK